MSVINISARVGINAKNRNDDVMKVQVMLNHFRGLGKLAGVKALALDGDFGSIRRGPTSPGRIFAFDDESYSSLWMYAAQAGGWMYPLWGVSTALPLYIGLQGAGYLHSVYSCSHTGCV